ncbi:MAG: hypothetical protein WC558_03645 [Patulibacter sp.]
MGRIDTRSPIFRGGAVLVATLLLQLAFLGSYVGALHEPKPHSVPVAVVGPAAVADRLNGLPGSPLRATAVASREAGERRVAQRDAYAVLVPGDASATAAQDRRSQLYVATAANRTMATVLPTVFDRLAAEQGQPTVRVHELAALPPEDSNGLAGFYAVVSWMVGGYFGATLLGMVGRARSRNRRFAAYRLGGMAGLGLASGLLSAVLLQHVIGVFGDASFLSLTLIGALVVFAVGAATIAFQSLLGIAGTGIAVLLFVVLGNPSSGGPFSPELLPGFWSGIGTVLPPGAGTTLVRNVVYFDGHAVGGPILVLLLWALVGVVVTVIRGGRAISAEQAEQEAAAGVAAI